MTRLAAAPPARSVIVARALPLRRSALRILTAADFEKRSFRVAFWPAATCLRAIFDLIVLRPAFTAAIASHVPATDAVQPTVSVPRKRCRRAPDGVTVPVGAPSRSPVVCSPVSGFRVSGPRSTKRAAAGSAGPQSGDFAPGAM